MGRQTYTQHDDLISVISFLQKEKLAKHHLTVPIYLSAVYLTTLSVAHTI
jgi:hypothetical protein